MAMRKPRTNVLSQERLKEVLEYSPANGKFTWKRGLGGKRVHGVEAGLTEPAGYIRITIDRMPFHAHRLAWLYVYGEWPYDQITFVNGKNSDCRIANLRLKSKTSRKKPALIPQERVKEVLDYDPEAGVFTWKKALSQRVRVGSVAGVVGKNGYRTLSIDSVHFLAHRLAWFWVHGEWPEHMIDHINGIRDDNRIANLRKATAQQNGLNGPLRKTNTSGFKGVSYATRRKKWTARITSNYRVHILGYFNTKEEAYSAYCKAARELHGEFARTS